MPTVNSDTTYDKYILSISSGVILAGEDIAKNYDISIEDVISICLRYETKKESPISTLLRYAIDVASDEAIEEEFYQSYPSVLDFLSQSGSANMEIQFMSFVRHHPDIFICKEPNCDGIIIGQCPKMICNKCNRKYYVIIDSITSDMCNQCIAQEVGECVEKNRITRMKIYA